VLIATNGIISPKLAGKVRYLDSRPDEQLRGITMESSAISLYFSMLRRSSPEAEPHQKEYLINLIDSPGHIDFSSEVSTASRLCDGALVLVDAVEGVCSQTVTVLRQTWTEHLKPILVINKVDRLITELRMKPEEAYVHLSKLLEQVNAVIGSFFQGERMEEDLQWRERVGERVAVAAAKDEQRSEKKRTKSLDGKCSDDAATAVETPENDGFEEKDDEDLYFAPEKNNVIFSSAVDGWAFTVRQFASIYEKKLGMKRSILEKVLWGDFYLDPKTKRVLASRHLKGRALKPMFVQLVLDNIWAVYEATTGRNKGKGCVCVSKFVEFCVTLIDSVSSDPGMVEKITKLLSLPIPPHVLRSKDPRVIYTAILGAWLPLSTAVLVSVIEYLPSPSAAQADRLPRLIDRSPGAEFVSKDVRDAIVELKASRHDPVIAYVSKMVAIPRSELPGEKSKAANSLTGEEAREIARRKRAEIARTADKELSQDLNGAPQAPGLSQNDRVRNGNDAAEEPEQEPEVLIGFARLFSGVLSVGDSIYVLPPKFTPANPFAAPEPQKVLVTGLYLMMGRGLENLMSIPPGVVFGIAGLDGHILKSGTLSSHLEGAVNLAGISMGSPPIVRVALEPSNPSDLGKLISGMQLLEQSDPCAQYEVLESGEHVISTAGELHLERCLKDLRERFARCEIQAGEPIVPYRETIVDAPEMAPPKNKSLPRGTVVGVTTSKQITVRLRVTPLPTKVTEFLVKNERVIRRLYAQKKSEEKSKGEPREIMEADLDNDDTPHSLEVPSDMPSMLEFKKSLQSVLTEENGQHETWANVVDKIVAFGPRRVGPNLFIDETEARTSENLYATSYYSPGFHAPLILNKTASKTPKPCSKTAPKLRKGTNHCQAPSLTKFHTLSS
jgi:ribosome assembly protein 1